jgi:hypothetical protein
VATSADIDADLTLELDGLGVNPERFQRGIRAFFGVLGEVTRSVCSGQPVVRWRVQVKAGSNLIGVVPVPGFRPEVVGTIASALRDGIVSLEESDAQPQYFTEAAMRYARDLGDISESDDDDEVRVRLWARKHPMVISHHTVANVMEALAGEFEDHGSIDGRLQTLSERGAMRFVIYDTLTDRAVQCFISDGKLADAIESFRKRVEVYGLIKYRKDGTALSIDVEDIVQFPEPPDIPDFRSVRGILRTRD